MFTTFEPPDAVLYGMVLLVLWFSQGILRQITRDLKLDHCGDESSVVQSCGGRGRRKSQCRQKGE